MTLIRLNKFLSQSGRASRRGADKLIEEGLVTINGRIAKLGDKVTGKEKIFVKNEAVGSVEKKEYIMLYKPVGIVSTADDEMGRQKVIDLVKSKSRLYPVGRLDIDSEGLIILTNDGDLALRLTHPKFHLEKEYEVTTDKNIVDRRIDTGINKITKVHKNKMTIVMYEGKKRQIRKMCWEAGLRVRVLKRVRVGSVNLGNLQPGEYRDLTPREVVELKRL
ncbi:MAG TPA: pseudouridine synthase [Candidatus Methanoperedens sp.]|nr:pseudouridine synthase [Candidatus Methanoperedens sp.]